MNAVSSCPSAEELNRLLLGQLGDPEAERLEQHFAQCSRCGERVQTLLAEDSLVEATRTRARPGEEQDTALVEALVNKVRQLRPSPVDPAALASAATAPPAGEAHSPLDPPAAGTEELYPFLAPPQGAGELGRLGPYRVLEVLGSGGMGVVFRAEDPDLERPVALKVMLPGLAASATARPRFLREARAAAAVKHDHIVSIYQVGEDRGVPFLAMEFLEGEPLDKRLERDGRLPLPDVLRLGREMALGLAAAHARGLVHRDVKPANVWLEGETGRVKVLDFGLARAAGGEAQLTQEGAIVGTPAYMAPEQASSQAVDARCDLFSLGCVLYRACTGKPPFTGRDTLSTLMAVATDQPPPPRERNPEVTPALNDLIVRLLAKSPADRPQSAREVVQALEAIERAAPPAGTTATNSGGRFGHRRWWPAAVAAGLLAAVALAVVIVLQIKDDKGEGMVRIETVDPDVEVVVKSGGREFTIYDKKSRQDVTLPVGRYEVELKGGKDGLKLETDRFTLKRGDRAVVQVTWSPEKGPGAGTESVRGPRPAPLDCTGPEGASAVEVRRAQAAWAKYLGRPVEETVEVGDGVKMTFVLIPPGKFLMGSPSEEQDYVTKTFPQRGAKLSHETLHEVTLTEPFDLAKTEVKQAQYEALGAENPSHFQGDNLPVENVSWTEARNWMKKLTKERGDKHLYRLPTEAEWEYSCRGGRSSSQPFGIGDGRALSSREANIDGRFPYGGADKSEQSKGTCPVASYPANAFGLYDMHGNVWEWCQDCYGPYPPGAATNPTGPSVGPYRAIRGGCWGPSAGDCRAASRYWCTPAFRNDFLGFRLARSVASGVK